LNLNVNDREVVNQSQSKLATFTLKKNFNTLSQTPRVPNSCQNVEQKSHHSFTQKDSKM